MFREDEENEFKKTTGELNEAMVSISAMLNKHGHGAVFFGLKNNGRPNPFIINDSTLRDVSRKIFESIKPQIFPTVQTRWIDEAEVVVVTFQGQDAPYSAFGKYYIRIADEDRELSPAELKKMMIGKEYEENWENRSSSETVRDVDEATVQRFYRAATECGRLPAIGSDAETLLHKLGLTNGERLTNAGRMLFSGKAPLTLKMAVFATDHKTTFLDIVQEEGNILQLIEVAMKYIIRNIRWSVKTGNNGLERIETPEIPIDALREAVVNSFAHARYDVPVHHEIDIFSNRISIINPGDFANSFSPDDFYHRDLHSFLRNETIAKTLYLCKNVETFGSGLRKIYTLCGESGVSVTFSNEESSFMLELSRHDRNAMPSDEIKTDMLSNIEAEVMNQMKEKPRASIAELARLCDTSVSTVNRAIVSLKNKKLIERVGPRRGGTWNVR